ncbi:MAG: NUDIX hydrolase [Myxococcota bacterium]
MHAPVSSIEILEDFSATARCDEGFLRLKRLRCRNLRSDGSTSPIYRVDVIDRPQLDAVAVLVHRRSSSGIEVLTRMQLRPAAYFRKERAAGIPCESEHLFVEEIVAGVLEHADVGEAGLRVRAAEEVREEAGIVVSPEEMTLLGAPFFLAPGILSEKIHLAAVDVTGKAQGEALGDGSPLEESAILRWRPIAEVLSACRSGEIQDAKTELAVRRFLDAIPSPSGRGRG